APGFTGGGGAAASGDGISSGCFSYDIDVGDVLDCAVESSLEENSNEIIGGSSAQSKRQRIV
ncbi:hypothetical protein L195_g061066, partial [Trifolium pratense]